MNKLKINLAFILIILLEFHINNVCTNFMANENSVIYKTLNRQKRKLPLIFHDFGVSQYVCGFGIPVDSEYFESVTSGIVFKSQLPLPASGTDLRNYTTHNVNGGRRYMDSSSHGEQSFNKHLRWEFYKILEIWADSMGLNGRACVLKTLCEVSQIPFDNDTGDLWHEVAHVLFTPFSSLDVLTQHTYNEYLAASNIGLTPHINCDHIFRECPKSILNIFTSVF